jgi:hypothetical protein
MAITITWFPSATGRTTVCTMTILGALLGALLAQPARADGTGQADSTPSGLPEVVVTARKLLDRETLKQAAITFTQSHATLTPRTEQISHWEDPVCPVTRGLQPQYDEYVSHRVMAIAKEAGAPSGASHCRVDVQIVFTRDPQAEVDRIAKIAPNLLGYTGGSFKRLVTVRFPIQAWYVTGSVNQEGDRDFQVDSKFGMVTFDQGRYPGRFRDVVSQIGYVIVAVDETRILQYSVDAIADYIAMLVLTRTAEDGCNVLPSIIDLLSPDCGSRERPQALTQADREFLKALYSTHFGMKLNFEQSHITEQLVHTLGR